MASWKQGLGGDRTCPTKTKSPESAERAAPRHIAFLTPNLWAVLRAMSTSSKTWDGETWTKTVTFFIPPDKSPDFLISPPSTHKRVHAHSYSFWPEWLSVFECSFWGDFYLGRSCYVMFQNFSYVRCVSSFVMHGVLSGLDPEQKVPVTQSEGRTRKLCPLNDLGIRSVLRGH